MKSPIIPSKGRRKLLILLSIFSFVFSSAFSQIKFGNSYVNLSKKTSGGTVQPGDLLEIRVNIWFPNNHNSGTVYYVRYLDNIPTNTTFEDDSLRLITNEGLLYKKWTLAADTDPGRYNASPGAGEYHIKINLGKNATAPNNTSNNTTGAGNVITGASGGTKDKPRAGGNVLITTSFKVRVAGNVGDTIILGAGQIRFRNSTGGSEQIYNAIQYKILISNNDPICPNSIGRNFVAEAGGTFDSGTVQNRAYAPTFLIPGYNYMNVTSGPQLADGNYAIVNNLSPTGSTNQNAKKQPNCSGSTPANACTNRMFGGVWDIIGDHTGAATTAGKAPAPVGTLGGYMLVVNADYATSEAYRQTISGLCPNTSYEFSLWVKNVCSVCGADSLGTLNYKPGVYPNLSFAIDGLDRYSSGQIDTTGWMKKGFLFKTGTSQTTITISIRNNASGGGGNDWAIDDIALVTCNPNLNLVPTGDQQVCINSQVDISSTVTSFFNNYTHYRFERSTDNGLNWTVPGSGTGTPVPAGSEYQYVAHLVPSFLADLAHHNNQYRFVVASSAANLSNPDCSFTASTKIIVLVDNCSEVLDSKDSTSRIRRNIDRYGWEPGIRKLVNPFGEKISFELITEADAKAGITVMDNFGRVLKQTSIKTKKGINPVVLDQFSGLSKGTYLLRIDINNQIINRLLVKTY